MTYGWAILIIAVVLSVLFQLGVFSSGNFQPHAQPGSCQVSRTVAGVSLEGQCNGMLPEYVAGFIPSSSAMSSGYGISDVYISSNSLIAPQGTPNAIFTITAWVDPTAYGTCNGYCVVPIVSINNQYFAFGIQPGGGLGIHGCGNPDVTTSGMAIVPFNSWTFISVSYSSSGYYSFQEDAMAPYTTSNKGFTINSPGLLIGSQASCNGATFEGSIANVQIYNVSLAQPEITALYDEGIGGAPIRPQNLTGWWPLNGNANDYSGNNNNGVPSNVIYSSSWESSYTAP